MEVGKSMAKDTQEYLEDTDVEGADLTKLIENLEREVLRLEVELANWKDLYVAEKSRNDE